MDFSEIIQNVSLAEIAPDGKHFAVTDGYTVLVRDIQSEEVSTYKFEEQISSLVFSPNSQFFMAVMGKSNVLELRGVEDQEWKCRIADSKSGISGARWIPDSQQIMTIANFQLRASVYSLVTKKMTHIKNPKYSDKGVCFNSTGKFMALAERDAAKDFIGVYFTQDWKLVNVRSTTARTAHLTPFSYAFSTSRSTPTTSSTSRGHLTTPCWSCGTRL